MVKIEAVKPILSVGDVDVSIAYYVEKLGFELSWCWGEPTAFACVTAGRFEIYLCKDYQGKPGTWIAIDVDDVDALYIGLRDRGADVRQPPTNFEWGVREMNVRDPDGASHSVRVANRRATGWRCVRSRLTRTAFAAGDALADAGDAVACTFGG